MRRAYINMPSHSLDAPYRLKAGWKGTPSSGGLHLPLARDSVTAKRGFHPALYAPAAMPDSLRASEELSKVSWYTNLDKSHENAVELTRATSYRWQGSFHA